MRSTRSVPGRVRVLTVLGGVFALAASTILPTGLMAGAAVPDRQAVLTPVAISVLAPPQPVVGADGRTHLAYELVLQNQSSATVTVQSIGATSGAGATLEQLSGVSLDAVTRLDNGQQGTAPVLAAGEGAYVFMDVTISKGQVPNRLEHHFSLAVQPSGANGEQPPTQQINFVGVATPVVGVKPVVVAPPLTGGSWVVGNGCCDAITAHRGATLPINGTVHAPERFAIDFVELDAQNRLYTGDPSQNASFNYFGVPVHSVASGTVVSVTDGEQENTPGALPANATIQTAGGNDVVVDIGSGHYAFYAHLQPGSIRVKKGQSVKTGQVLGLLGNTGNTDAPHLHFHIMDGPSPLQSNGLPFEFTSFVGQGRVTDADAISPPFTGAPAPIDPTYLLGRHTNQMPLNLEIVKFPGR